LAISCWLLAFGLFFLGFELFELLVDLGGGHHFRLLRGVLAGASQGFALEELGNVFTGTNKTA